MRNRALFAALLTVALAGPALAEDPHGKQVFQICAACHSGGPDAAGPSLIGVVGRKAGSLPDFRYSGAMQRSGLTWTPENLQRYLTDPQGVVPGNRMPLTPLSPADAKAVVGYLQTLKG